MSQLVYPLSYAALVVFVAAIVARCVRYLRQPLHVRWELYPVAHEGKKASYGGGFMEEVDWPNKPRTHSLAGTLKVMAPEILFLKAVWEHNRSLWTVSYAFHLGLYLNAAFVALLAVGGLARLAGADLSTGSALGFVLIGLANVLGPIGFLLCLLGAIGLFHRRWTDEGLRNYSSFGHFFNLALFILVMSLALLTWLFVDRGFDLTRSFIVSLITFHPRPIGSTLFALLACSGVALLAYIPLTHMSHFFMKWFLYHDIRWGDELSAKNPSMEAKILVALNYPVSWAAPHIAGDGKKTWAQVATHNPTQPLPKEKE